MSEQITPYNAAPCAWTNDKPTLPGAYWIKGAEHGNPEQVSLVQIDEHHGKLICSIGHDPSDQTNYAKEDWYDVTKLDETFQWQGPLKRPMLPNDPWHRDPTDDQVKADVYDELCHLLGPHMKSPGDHGPDKFLTSSIYESVEFLLSAFREAQAKA